MASSKYDFSFAPEPPANKATEWSGKRKSERPLISYMQRLVKKQGSMAPRKLFTFVCHDVTIPKSMRDILPQDVDELVEMIRNYPEDLEVAENNNGVIIKHVGGDEEREKAKAPQFPVNRTPTGELNWSLPNDAPKREMKLAPSQGFKPLTRSRFAQEEEDDPMFPAMQPQQAQTYVPTTPMPIAQVNDATLNELARRLVSQEELQNNPVQIGHMPGRKVGGSVEERTNTHLLRLLGQRGRPFVAISIIHPALKTVSADIRNHIGLSLDDLTSYLRNRPDFFVVGGRVAVSDALTPEQQREALAAAAWDTEAATQVTAASLTKKRTVANQDALREEAIQLKEQLLARAEERRRVELESTVVGPPLSQPPPEMYPQPDYGGENMMPQVSAAQQYQMPPPHMNPYMHHGMPPPGYPMPPPGFMPPQGYPMPPGYMPPGYPMQQPYPGFYPPVSQQQQPPPQQLPPKIEEPKPKKVNSSTDAVLRFLSYTSPSAPPPVATVDPAAAEEARKFFSGLAALLRGPASGAGEARALVSEAILRAGDKNSSLHSHIQTLIALNVKLLTASRCPVVIGDTRNCLLSLVRWTLLGERSLAIPAPITSSIERFFDKLPDDFDDLRHDYPNMRQYILSQRRYFEILPPGKTVRVRKVEMSEPRREAELAFFLHWHLRHAEIVWWTISHLRQEVRRVAVPELRDVTSSEIDAVLRDNPRQFKLDGRSAAAIARLPSPHHADAATIAEEAAEVPVSAEARDYTRLVLASLGGSRQPADLDKLYAHIEAGSPLHLFAFVKTRRLFRRFLERQPDVFVIEGESVRLAEPLTDWNVLTLLELHEQAVYYALLVLESAPGPLPMLQLMSTYDAAAGSEVKAYVAQKFGTFQEFISAHGGVFMQPDLDHVAPIRVGAVLEEKALQNLTARLARLLRQHPHISWRVFHKLLLDAPDDLKQYLECRPRFKRFLERYPQVFVFDESWQAISLAPEYAANGWNNGTATPAV